MKNDHTGMEGNVPERLQFRTDDEILQLCLIQARKSNCQRAWFGAILMEYDTNNIVATGYNHKLPELEHLCTPDCIRLDIQSRTQSLLGACIHAEEDAIRNAMHAGHTEFDAMTLFFAGLPADAEEATSPFEFSDYGCLRCATACLLHGIRFIAMWTGTEFEHVHIQTALLQAVEYYTGAKTR